MDRDQPIAVSKVVFDAVLDPVLSVMRHREVIERLRDLMQLAQQSMNLLGVTTTIAPCIPRSEVANALC